jgi:HD superfamily phosphohydrolase
VIHLMQEALEHLASACPSAGTEDARVPLLAASLLHDVGHGPFSHVSEVCLGIQHEHWSCRILRDPETQVHQVLRRLSPSLPEAVAALIAKDDTRAPLWQKSLLSSQLDVDRLDYLRRDSLFTGAGYGHFDWFRILHTFTLHGETDRDRELVWTDKARYAIEEYIFARYYMYRNVYLHKTTRGFERMLEAIWRLARQLRDDGEDVRLLKPVAEFWDRPDPSVRHYLAFEEFVLLSQVQAWTEHPHKALSDLARRFLGRQRFTAVEAPPRAGNPLGDAEGEWQRALEELVRGQGYEPVSAYVLRDDLETAISKAYVPEKESDEQQPINAIRLCLDGAARPVEVSQLLPRLRAVIDEPARQVRYYVPAELQREVIALRSKWELLRSPAKSGG